MQTYKVIVAGTNRHGLPDFFHCLVRCSYEEYMENEHCVLAERKALDADFEPRISFSEDDPGFQRIQGTFDWDSAKSFTV